jgi:dTDP-4-dehydrorhamnose reductase
MHNVNVENPILVIGASGYLGQCITRLLGVRAIATHCSTPKFSTSLRYDLYADVRTMTTTKALYQFMK